MVHPENLAGEPLPTIFVDGRAYEGEGASMTGAQILAVAGLDADGHALFAEGHRGRRIGDEEEVPVRDGARFVTRPRPG